MENNISKQYNNYTFSKSIIIKTIYMNEIRNDFTIFDNEDDLFFTCINNTNYILILLENSLLGIFLTHSEIIPLEIIKTYLEYYEQENKISNIVKLPNKIDPRLNKYFLEIPKMINKPICEWNNNFYTLIKEINPNFPEIQELEIDEKIYQCINCKIGYKLSENTSTSCKFHSGEIIQPFSSTLAKMSCCGITSNISTQCCKTGYHINKL